MTFAHCWRRPPTNWRGGANRSPSSISERAEASWPAGRCVTAWNGGRGALFSGRHFSSEELQFMGFQWSEGRAGAVRGCGGRAEVTLVRSPWLHCWRYHHHYYTDLISALVLLVADVPT